MNCKEAKVLIPAFLDREVPEEARSRLEAHLESCSGCREALDDCKRQDAGLRRLFQPRRRAAAAIPERIMARLPPLPPSAPPRFDLGRPRTFFSYLAAAVAAGFLAATLLFRPWETRVAEVPLVTGREKTAEVPAEKAPEQGEQVKEAPVEPPVATLALATTAAEVEILPPGAGAWQRLSPGGGIPAAARLRTGAGTRCECRGADGSEMRLDWSTELVFRSARRLELITGRLWSNVEKGESPFSVSVPQAEAAITALGTKFDVSSRAEEATVIVVEGSVKVEGREGEGEARIEKIVNAGEELKVRAGRLAAQSQVYDLVVATRWVHELLVLEGKNNPELEKRINELFARIGREKLAFLYEEEIRLLGDHCVLPMTRYLQSDEWRGDPAKRQTAARILSDLAQPWSVPDLIDLLADEDPEVRYSMAAALKRLTGHTHGVPVEEWKKLAGEALSNARAAWKGWWEKNQARYPKNPY